MLFRKFLWKLMRNNKKLESIREERRKTLLLKSIPITFEQKSEHSLLQINVKVDRLLSIIDEQQSTINVLK